MFWRCPDSSVISGLKVMDGRLWRRYCSIKDWPAEPSFSTFSAVPWSLLMGMLTGAVARGVPSLASDHLFSVNGSPARPASMPSCKILVALFCLRVSSRKSWKRRLASGMSMPCAIAAPLPPTFRQPSAMMAQMARIRLD